MNSDQYKTIKTESMGLFKDRGSKFYSFSFPVQTEEEINIYREEIKKKYHDARHHVYAYRIGADMKNFRSSDDGEPSNSSGPPILGKIRSYELTDILIIVIRYFGGTKLGIPGLINAYGTAAEDAIQNADIIIKTVVKNLSVKFEYPEMNAVMRIIKENNLKVNKQDFQISCRVDLEIAAGKFEKIKKIFESNHKLELIQY